MKRIAPMVAALVSSLALTIALIGTPAAISATTTTTSTTTTTTAASGTPIVTTGGTLDVTPTTGDFVGTVNLNGATLATSLLSSNCYFTYGVAGTTSTTTVACANTPASTGTTTVVGPVTGLTAGKTYNYTLSVVTGGLLGIAATTTTGTSQSVTTPVATVPPTATTTAASLVGGTTATLNGTVNPENWSISACTFSYSASGGTAVTAPCSAIPSGSTGQAVSAAVTGLAAGTAYSYSLSVTYTPAASTGTTTTTTTTTTTSTTPAAATVTSSSAASFTTLSAQVTAPTNLASTTATLNASVNPEGQTISDCSLYYGTAVATLTKVACTLAPASITGTSPVSVAANITGLTQKTEYLDTVVLTTASGATVVAPLGNFTTPATPLPPIAKTTAANAITATTATLHAQVNAEGQGIRGCEFEWGVNNLTSTSTPGDDLALTELCSKTPADSGTQDVSVTLKGLAPGTKYYFRVLFLTYGGYVVANTESFTTAKSAAATTKPKLKITGVSLNKKTKVAKFKIARSGTPFVTTGFQCALVTVKNGKAAAPKYATCPPLKIYQKLKAGGTYVFYARGGNKNGYGAAVSRKFTI